MLVVAVVLAPVLVSTSINTIALAGAAAACLLYGGTRLLPVSGTGVLFVLLELETVWNTHHLVVEIAAAVAGIALLAAFELRVWQQQLVATPSDRDVYRAQVRSLAAGLGVIAAATAVLVGLSRGFAHGPALGVAGGVAVLAIGAGITWLARRAGAPEDFR